MFFICAVKAFLRAGNPCLTPYDDVIYVTEDLVESNTHSLMTLVNKENVKVKQRFSTQEQKVGPQWLQNKSLIKMKEYERLASDFFEQLYNRC